MTGITNLSDENAQRRKIKSCEKHENFFYIVNPSPHVKYDIENDIAICEVTENFEFNENVSKIDLTTEFVKENEECFTVGWGATHFINESLVQLSDDLKLVMSNSLSTEECQLLSQNEQS